MAEIPLAGGNPGGRLGDAPGGERLDKRVGPGQTVADGRQVARAAAAQGEARQRPFHVRAALQAIPDSAARRLTLDKELHHVQPARDGLRIGERSGEMGGQEPAAGAGRGAVDQIEQAVPPLAGQALDELQVAPGGGVDFHGGALLEPARPAEARQLPLLGELNIFDQRPGGGQLGAAEAAERIQRLDLI